MTFKFKGRPRRGLLWEKSVYNLWFDYAKVSPRPIPKEFGNLAEFDSFEEWWKHPDYGFELFCEPAKERGPIEIVKAISEPIENNVLFIRVDLTEPTQKLKRMFSNLLQKYQDIMVVNEPKSRARFQPSMPQRHMKMEALRRYLESWKMRNRGESRRDIYYARYNPRKLTLITKPTEDQLRPISRDYQRANEVFRSIEKGTFP